MKVKVGTIAAPLEGKEPDIKDEWNEFWDDVRAFNYKDKWILTRKVVARKD